MPLMTPEEKTETPLKRTEFLILAALEDGPLHGYGLVQAIEQRTDGAVAIRPGDLYRVLHRLVQRGLLEEAGRRKPRGSEERRTTYRSTRRGRTALRQEAHVLSGVIATLEGSA